MIKGTLVSAGALLALLGLAAATPAEASFSTQPLPLGTRLRFGIEGFRLPLLASEEPIHNFFRPSSDWGAGHRGVDYLAKANQEILAPHDGVIAFGAGVFGVPTVVLDRADGSSSVFQPACLQPGFELDQKVASGEAIAKMCSGTRAVDHCQQLTCLHWGFRLSKEVYLNPLKFTGTFAQPVLLPINQARG